MSASSFFVQLPTPPDVLGCRNLFAILNPPQRFRLVQLRRAGDILEVIRERFCGLHDSVGGHLRLDFSHLRHHRRDYPSRPLDRHPYFVVQIIVKVSPRDSDTEVFHRFVNAGNIIRHGNIRAPHIECVVSRNSLQDNRRIGRTRGQRPNVIERQGEGNYAAR